MIQIELAFISEKDVQMTNFPLAFGPRTYFYADKKRWLLKSEFPRLITEFYASDHDSKRPTLKFGVHKLRHGRTRVSHKVTIDTNQNSQLIHKS